MLPPLGVRASASDQDTLAVSGSRPRSIRAERHRLGEHPGSGHSESPGQTIVGPPAKPPDCGNLGLPVTGSVFVIQSPKETPRRGLLCLSS
jgi:hypothetical protein